MDFLRITAISPSLRVADPQFNCEVLLHELHRHSNSDVILFPELSVTGYTCGELFLQETLLETAAAQLRHMIANSANLPALVVVGIPFRVGGGLFNCAAVFQAGSLLGIVPKQYLPNYQEFYEARWFQSGTQSTCSFIQLDSLQIPFGTDLLFSSPGSKAVVGIEICEDLWMPIPPSSRQSLAGANVLLNLSASNETIGKASYRKSLIEAQSGRCIAAYAYSSAGPSESTTDLVFGGHCLVAECGSMLAESQRIGEGLGVCKTDDPGKGKDDAPRDQNFATTDIDLQRIHHDRQLVGTFHQFHDSLQQDFRHVNFETRIEFETQPSTVSTKEDHVVLNRHVPAHPFVPSQSSELTERCREVFEIQRAGLAKRIQQLPPDSSFHIGVSGGLDSTLALIVAVDTIDALGWERSRIHGLTMPGFGTSSQTLENARVLMSELDITQSEIDIRPLCMQSFADLQHSPLGVSIDGLDADSLQTKLESLDSSRRSDLVFENVQARIRTFLLMSRGFVLGTGDLSEMALGWCTYNADHMSMYNVNCSIPKTLVRFLVEYTAQHRFGGAVSECLMSIAQTPISPELLPLSPDQEIQQSTEESIGPYELHDFFLYHFVRSGAPPRKILLLASQANFSRAYTADEIRSTLRVFLRRFFVSQFKRTCVPDGPKVGSVSLSPRGDWKMPTDASTQAWLRDLEG